jgi:regulator of sirC expression with transglutaminase-like and TPR domain
MNRLDELAANIKQRLGQDSGYENSILELNQFLFDDYGLSGNIGDYYDPRNSFLNDVLDRKLGIPITLAIVYIEVGRRLGLPLEGVSFPGHFLVKLEADQGDVVLDPFSGGICLSEEDLIARLEDMPLEEHPPVPELARAIVAQPTGKKQILARILRNLKQIYVHHGELTKALGMINRLLLITPNLPDEVRERAGIYEQLECFQAAHEDYERYLRLEPGAPDAPDVHKRIVELQRVIAGIN